MTSIDYFNRQVSLLDIFFESHNDLIDKIAYELELSKEKTEELKAKYLDKPTKLKAKKDPNQPKKARTSYLFFSDKFRTDNAAMLQGKYITEISKIIGNAWKNLDDDTRKQMEEKATKDKERYKSEYEAYQQSLFNNSIQYKEK